MPDGPPEDSPVQDPTGTSYEAWRTGAYDAAAEAGQPADLGARGRLTGAHHVHDPKQARDFVGLGAEAQGGLAGHG